MQSWPLPRPSLTYAEHQAYSLGVLGFPGPVDWWLITNSKMLCINFLKDYLLLECLGSEHITCTVESCYKAVSYIPCELYNTNLWFLEFMNRNLSIMRHMRSICYILQHQHQPILGLIYSSKKVLGSSLTAFQIKSGDSCSALDKMGCTSSRVPATNGDLCKALCMNGIMGI